MKTKVKARKQKIPSRFKKIGELLPSFGKFRKELDDAYKLSKRIPSTASLHKLSSSGSDIILPKNIDDAKLNLLCTDPKELKYAWDVFMRYQLDEINEKKPMIETNNWET